MARKPRTPPPPRRVQAPKTRRPERGGPGRRALALLAAAVVVAAAVGVGAFLLLRSDDEAAAENVLQVMEAAGCTYQEAPAGPRTHIPNDNATPKEWNTDPPTSGPHFGSWVIWGEYEDPVQKARAVHNLEHGGIWITYGDDVPPAEVENLRRFYREDPDAMLLSPLPELGDEIALAAWYQPTEDEGGKAAGVLAKCKGFDETALETFRDTYRFKGPERFPQDDLEPGE